MSAPHCPQKTAPWVAEGAPHSAGVAQGGDAIEEQPSNRQLAVVPEGAEPRSMEKPVSLEWRSPEQVPFTTCQIAP